MKFAAVRDLQIKASEVVRQSQQEPVIITIHGRPKAVLTAVTEDELEDFLFEHSPKLRKRIEEGLKDLQAGRVIFHNELKHQLKSRLNRDRKGPR